MKVNWYDTAIKEVFGCGDFNTWVNFQDALSQSISEDYVEDICMSLFADVAKDLEACADKDWNDDDMRLAIGRVLCERLGIER